METLSQGQDGLWIDGMNENEGGGEIQSFSKEMKQIVYFMNMNEQTWSVEPSIHITYFPVMPCKSPDKIYLESTTSATSGHHLYYGRVQNLCTGGLLFGALPVLGDLFLIFDQSSQWIPQPPHHKLWTLPNKYNLWKWLEGLLTWDSGILGFCVLCCYSVTIWQVTIWFSIIRNVEQVPCVKDMFTPAGLIRYPALVSGVGQIPNDTCNMGTTAKGTEPAFTRADPSRNLLLWSCSILVKLHPDGVFLCTYMPTLEYRPDKIWFLWLEKDLESNIEFCWQN